MSETKNGRLGLYGAEHSKCNHMMTLGFKGLIASALETQTNCCWSWCSMFYLSSFLLLARDAFVIPSRRAIPMMFVSLSIRLSVCLGRVCIVIIRCTLARIEVYDWIVQCSGHPITKTCPPTPSRLFQFHLEHRCCMYVQTRCDISRTVEDRG